MTPAEIQGQGHGYADGDMEEVIVAEATYVCVWPSFSLRAFYSRNHSFLKEPSASQFRREFGLQQYDGVKFERFEDEDDDEPEAKKLKADSSALDAIVEDEEEEKEVEKDEKMVGISLSPSAFCRHLIVISLISRSPLSNVVPLPSIPALAWLVSNPASYCMC